MTLSPLLHTNECVSRTIPATCIQLTVSVQASFRIIVPIFGFDPTRLAYIRDNLLLQLMPYVYILLSHVPVRQTNYFSYVYSANGVFLGLLTKYLYAVRR
jgi:hypothetical protein